MVEMQRVMILNQDPPEHAAMRHIVSRAFAPRSIAQLEQIMRDRAHRIVTEAVEADKDGRGLNATSSATSSSSSRWPATRRPATRSA